MHEQSSITNDCVKIERNVTIGHCYNVRLEDLKHSIFIRPALLQGIHVKLAARRTGTETLKYQF